MRGCGKRPDQRSSQAQCLFLLHLNRPATVAEPPGQRAFTRETTPGSRATGSGGWEAHCKSRLSENRRRMPPRSAQ